jgi:hypothetical protein
MEQNLENLLKDLALEQLMKSPLGDQIQHAMHIFDKVQTHYFALVEKQDEMGMTGIKAVTVLTFAILRKIADGKLPSQLDGQDWKEIAVVVDQYAVLADDQQYSVFIFSLYERYIRHSVQQIEGIISEETATVINGLADELHGKADALSAGYISEVTYIEDCLWISLEAMLKLLASTAALCNDQRIADFAQALTSYAFEYGRLMLYSRELEIVNQFIESQHQLDAELEQKYAAYLEDLQNESQQFYALVDNAFAPDFRDAFLHSILLAKTVGVKKEAILSSTEDIDSFFLD